MVKKIKWVGTLSTTERNNIGLIQVRQNNVNSEVLGFNIVDGNGEPYDLKNRKVLFCTYFDKFSPVEQYAEVIENGKIVYTMNEHDMQKPVRINFAYFKIMDEKGNLVDTTQNFSYDIMPSIESKCMNAEPYIIRLEEVLDAFNSVRDEAMKEMQQIIIDFNEQAIKQQQDFEFWFESIRDILESIDPGGVLLSEIVDFRYSKMLDKHFQRIKDRGDFWDEKVKENEIGVSKAMKSNFLKQQGLLVGHRGLMNLAPENSAISFELAGKYGMWGIETDCHETLDGKFYLYHDADLSSQTNGMGKIYEMSSEQLKDVIYTKAKGSTNYPNTPLCTLDEYLAIASKYNMFCILEIGMVNNHQGILDKIKSHNMEGNVLIFTNEYLVKTYRALDSFIPIGLVTWKVITDADINFCVENKVDALGIAISDGSVSSNMNRDLVNKCHENGLIVNMYIVNNYSDYNWCKNNFVDVVTTDHIIGGV